MWHTLLSQRVKMGSFEIIVTPHKKQAFLLCEIAAAIPEAILNLSFNYGLLDKAS